MKKTLILLVGVVLPLVFHAERAAGRPSTNARDGIDDRFKWDLTSVYESWSEWERALRAVEEAAVGFGSYKGNLIDGPERLRDVLDAKSDVLADAEKVWAYAYLNWVEDTRRPETQQRIDRANRLRADVEASVSWVIPELLELPEEMVRRWVEPEGVLADHRFPVLEILRTREHSLDVQGERLLSHFEPVNTALSSMYEAITIGDAEYPEVALQNGQVLRATGASSW